MSQILTKSKKSIVKSSRKQRDLPLGVSMLTLSGFRICQMRNKQLASVNLTKPKQAR